MRVNDQCDVRNPHQTEHNASTASATMINRRDVLKAVAAGALLSHCGTSLAQSSPSGPRKRKRACRRAGEVTGQGDAAIQNLLAPVRDEYHLPGLIGAIAIGSRMAAIGAVGIRKIGSPQAFQIADQVHLGSCTKAMTATMIASVVETGKLSWTSTFRSVFPESADKFHPQFQEATLSQLLTHRAGLPHDGPWWHLAGASTTKQRHCADALDAAPKHQEPAGFDLFVLECRLCPGCFDGRAGHGRLVGEPDEETAVRAARDGLRGFRLARREGRADSALGSSSLRPRVETVAAGQCAEHGPGRQCALFGGRLGQICRAASCGRAWRFDAVEAGDLENVACTPCLRATTRVAGS